MSKHHVVDIEYICFVYQLKINLVKNPKVESPDAASVFSTKERVKDHFRILL